ncbi:MAG: secretin, partial [Pseudaminobacter sp.]|nr:secretin [Pseudaminobacter sp.]
MFGWVSNSRRRGRHAAALGLLAISFAAGQFLLAAGSAKAGNDVVNITSTKNASIKLAKGKPRTIKTD